MDLTHHNLEVEMIASNYGVRSCSVCIYFTIFFPYVSLDFSLHEVWNWYSVHFFIFSFFFFWSAECFLFCVWIYVVCIEYHFLLCTGEMGPYPPQAQSPETYMSTEAQHSYSAAPNSTLFCLPHIFMFTVYLIQCAIQIQCFSSPFFFFFGTEWWLLHIVIYLTYEIHHLFFIFLFTLYFLQYSGDIHILLLPFLFLSQAFCIWIYVACMT